MKIELVEADHSDEPVLEHLLQLYQYDFSEIMGGDVGKDGRYGFVSLDGCWDDEDWHAFLVRVNGTLAGFAFVIERSHFTGDSGVSYMDEFFIMRRYRRSGVGMDVATRLFDMYPGPWEVAEVAPNSGATEFWRKVIGQYTGGRYDERFEESEQWHGPVQTFDTLQRVAVQED